MDDKLRKKLYNSFDKKLNEDQKRELENALRESEELKNEKEMIEKLRLKLSAQKNVSFKPFFETRVMSRIGQITYQKAYDIFFENLVRLFKPVIITATLVIISIASYNIATDNTFSIERIFGIPQVVFEDVLDSSISYNGEQ